MWLKISFAGRHPLLAAVARDGKLYFVAKDVGVFLGYSNANGFAKRHAARNLLDLIPEEFATFVQKGRRGVVDFDEMIAKMSDDRLRHRLPPEETIEVRRLWRDGFVLAQFPDLMPFASRLAFHLRIDGEGQVAVRDWIDHYVRTTLALFENERKVVVAPPSVESNFGAQEEEEETPAAGPAAGPPSFCTVVKAEGKWTAKSADVFDDVIRSMRRKFEEMEPSSDGGYELEVRLVQKRVRSS